MTEDLKYTAVLTPNSQSIKYQPANAATTTDTFKASSHKSRL